MGKIRWAVAALAVATAVGSLHFENANAAKKIALPAARAEELVTLETRALEAWKSKDAKVWDSLLADNFVGFGSSGRLNKALAKTNFSGKIVISRATLCPICSSSRLNPMPRC